MRRLSAWLVVALLMVGSGVYVAVRPVGDEPLRARLHDMSTGSVEHVTAIDPTYTRLTIGWQDSNLHSHHSRFDTDTYSWQVGEEFDVAYDARHPDREARPADPFYTSNEFLRKNARVEGGLLGTGGTAIALLCLIAARRRRMLTILGPDDPILSWHQMPLPSGPPRAWDAAHVHTRWWAYSWSGRRPVLAAVAVGVVASPALLLVHRNDERLLRHGLHPTGTATGGGGLLVARFGRRLMQQQPWVAFESAHACGAARVSQARYVDLRLSGGTVVHARLANATGSSLATFVVDQQGTRFCPGPGRRFLIDNHRLNRPYVALLPRSRRQAARWRKRSDGNQAAQAT